MKYIIRFISMIIAIALLIGGVVVVPRSPICGTLMILGAIAIFTLNEIYDE
jgi:hypothetical protein